MFDKQKYQKEYYKKYAEENKEALRKYREEYNQRNKDEIRKKKQERAVRDPEKYLRQKHDSYIRTREKHLETCKKYRTRPDRQEFDRLRAKEKRERFPGRYRARYLVGNAIKQGKLVRGKCVVCGTAENIQAHHDDYSKVFGIKWYCVQHHMELHRKHKTTAA